MHFIYLGIWPTIGNTTTSLSMLNELNKCYLHHFNFWTIEFKLFLLGFPKGEPPAPYQSINSTFRFNFQVFDFVNAFKRNPKFHRSKSWRLAKQWRTVK